MKAYTELYGKYSTNVRVDDISQQLKRFSINSIGLFFPQKTSTLIKRKFFTPSRKQLTTKEQQWIDEARNFQIRVHNKTIQCWQWGQGPEILAVHGWNGLGANLFPYFTPLLKKGYSVVTFDAPAHGLSEGEQTNYFEITDTVRAMVNSIGQNSLAGIVAHSLGGAAVINCLSKENSKTKTALIAPPLRLKELLYNTFEKNGVSKRWYTFIVEEIEKEYGYSMEHDNPYVLLEHLDSEVMIVHDRQDRVVPYQDSSKIANQHSNIFLHATAGLGHKHIIKDKNTIDAVLQYLSDSVSS